MKKVKRWKKTDVEEGLIFESDVTPEMRYLIDEYTFSEEPSPTHIELNFDIEVEVDNQLPDYRNAVNEITAIAYYEKNKKLYTSLIVDKEQKLHSINTVDADRFDVKIVSFDNEKELLQYFLVDFKKIKPTILTGWNIDFFDIPYLYNRLRKVFGQDIARKLSPIGVVKFNGFRERYFIAGISCLDYMAIYKNFTFGERVSYSLDAISKLELGEGKMIYDGTLQKLYETDINAYVEYNIHDVRLVKKIDDKMNFIDLAKGISHKGHVPFEDVYYSSRFLDGAILTYMKKIKMVAPNRPLKNKEYNEIKSADEKFSGAYVKDPVPGKHSWIYDLDLTSMYPGIIRSLNISPETKVTKIDNWNNKKYMQNNDTINFSFEMDDKMHDLNVKDLKEFLEDTKLSVSSNGVLYNTHIKGIIPSILENWFNERVDMKDLMKKFGNEGDDEKFNYYKGRQMVQKVLLNSLYGVLGLPTFRFFDIDNAEAVTTTGVDLIKFSEKIVNHYYNTELGTDEDYTIYIDTDSLFVSAEPLIKFKYPNADLTDEDFMSEKILEITSEIQDYINKSYNYFSKEFLNIDPKNHLFDMKQEVIAKAGFWTTKKRYALWVINNEGIKVDKMEVKGLDVVRTSFPKKFRDFMTGILTDILQDVDKDIIDKKVIAIKKEMKTEEISNIARPTGVKNIKKYTRKDSKPFGPHVNKAPVHVKASINFNSFLRHYKLEKKFGLIKNGEKVKWTYLKNNPFEISELAFRDNDEDPQVILDYINEYIDYEKIFESELDGKLQDFYDALHWGLISTKKNKNAGKFF